MHRREDFHHTPEQVAGYVMRASSLCDDVNLHEEERIALLPVMVTLLASKQIFYEQVGPIPDLSALGHQGH